VTWCTFDVPYKHAKVSSYAPWPDEDYEELVQILLKASFKWTLSEYDYRPHDLVYAPLGEPILRITVKKTMHNSQHTGGIQEDVEECLWSNLP
jgi:hypothetical protein